MIIHVVQPGETINSIADNYGKSVERLIQENDIVNPNNLVVGQTIVIVYPKQLYIIKEGDTLASIADTFGVPLMQLLQNNPYLSNREYIYPGETIVISYEDTKIMQISTNGYAFPFVNMNILKKTLPFLTYLTIFDYRFDSTGELNDIDENDIINIAKAYHVAPIMLISNATIAGEVDDIATHNLLNNEEYQKTLINNILIKLNTKGYYGLNIDFQTIRNEDRDKYVSFVTNLTNSLHREGYKVFVTITLANSDIEAGSINDSIAAARLGQATDGAFLISYSWGHSHEPPVIVMPFEWVTNLLDYAVTQVPPSKTFIGITNVGYLFQLPYNKDETIGQSITFTNSIQLASNVGATILYDETSQAAYYYYSDDNDYIVWFSDARRIDYILNLLPTYGFRGLGIWNTMCFPCQMFLLINIHYEIEKLL